VRKQPVARYTGDAICFLLSESVVKELLRIQIVNTEDFLLKLMSRLPQQQKFSSRIIEQLAVLKRLFKAGYIWETGRLCRQIDNLILEPGGFEAGDEWSNRVIADLKPIPDEQQAVWKNLLIHAQDSDKSEPTAKWLKVAEGRLAAVGRETVKEKLLIWFGWMQEVKVNYQLSDRNAAILKGLVWYCHHFSNEEILQGVAGLADACFRKIPGIGPRSLRVGNACVYILSSANNLYGVAQLDRLRQSIKNRSVLKQIEK
jgi:hypothetical protein